MTKKRIIIISAIILIVALLSVLIFAFAPEKQYSVSSWGYFDTFTKISGHARLASGFEKKVNMVFEALEEYHKLYDIYNEYEGINNLCTINKLYDGEHKVITVDRKIIDMLLYAKEMYAKTNGKTNIAMGSVLSIWHDYRTDAIDNHHGIGEPPPMDELVEASKHTDINDLIIDEENCTVYLADPQMKLDVGSIAKGYAVEMIAKMLEEKGMTGYVLNVGGNIRTIGTKSNGEKWLAGIENPDEESDIPYNAYIGLAGEAIVTSGSYQRYYFSVTGERYHHIIDPTTLMPAEYFVQVSVICSDSGLGDVLSTALFCMPIEEGKNFVESLEGVEVMWTFADGTIVKSSGFSNFEIEYNQ